MGDEKAHDEHNTANDKSLDQQVSGSKDEDFEQLAQLFRTNSIVYGNSTCHAPKNKKARCS